MALQMYPIAIGCILVVAVGTLFYNYVTTSRRQQIPYSYGRRTSDRQNSYEIPTPASTASVKSEDNESSKTRRRIEKRKNSVKICGVCLGDLKTSLRTLPCQHVFHDHCITVWMTEKKSCPDCLVQHK